MPSVQLFSSTKLLANLLNLYVSTQKHNCYVGITCQKTEGARHILLPSVSDARRCRNPSLPKINSYACISQFCDITKGIILQKFLQIKKQLFLNLAQAVPICGGLML